jgi:hypothetical protein
LWHHSPRKWARAMSTLKGSRRGLNCSRLRYRKQKILKRRRMSPCKKRYRTRSLQKLVKMSR